MKPNNFAFNFKVHFLMPPLENCWRSSSTGTSERCRNRPNLPTVWIIVSGFNEKIYIFKLDCMLYLFNYCVVQSSVYLQGADFPKWNDMLKIIYNVFFQLVKFYWLYFTIVKTNLLSTFTFDKNTKHEGSNYILN